MRKLPKLRMRATAIDLFCGCGGLSLGAEGAGFEILAGMDVNTQYMGTFTRNFPRARSILSDITALAPSAFAATLNVRPGDVTLVVGGPPCQGFSKNVPRRHRYMDDPRNLLVRAFIEYCEYLKPAFILMENVAEMRNGFESAYTQEVVIRLKRAGYLVEQAVLNAADFGVPQRRRRAFFLAARNGVKVVFPAPTHVRPAQEKDLFVKPNHVTVWEAIGDLPSVIHGEGSDPVSYASSAQSEYQDRMRTPSGMVGNHIARRLQPRQYQRLASLLPGQGLKDLPSELKTKGGYSGAYGRLTKDMIAPTVTRWAFHPGSGRWGHPIDIRTLTIREIARLQGFHDSFGFVGTFTQQAGQLGNAVPPLLAEQILRSLRKAVA